MMKIFRSMLFWEGLSFTVAFLGSRAMDENSMLWYSSLARSSLTPPNIAFPIVWSFLYALMGYSAFRVARKADFRALLPYMVQLLLNLEFCFWFCQMNGTLITVYLITASGPHQVLVKPR